jgi:hypothetical protein
MARSLRQNSPSWPPSGVIFTVWANTAGAKTTTNAMPAHGAMIALLIRFLLFRKAATYSAAG